MGFIGDSNDMIIHNNMIYLPIISYYPMNLVGDVGAIPTVPSEQYEFVNWDDDSQLNGKMRNVTVPSQQPT